MQVGTCLGCPVGSDQDVVAAQVTVHDWRVEAMQVVHRQPRTQRLRAGASAQADERRGRRRLQVKDQVAAQRSS